VPVRNDPIRGVAGRAIFQPLDSHFLIAAATEAVVQLQTGNPEFIAPPFPRYIDRRHRAFSSPSAFSAVRQIAVNTDRSARALMLYSS